MDNCKNLCAMVNKNKQKKKKNFKSYGNSKKELNALIKKKFKLFVKNKKVKKTKKRALAFSGIETFRH